MDQEISPAVILRTLTKEEYMDYFRKRNFLDKQYTQDAIKKFDDFTTQKSKPKIKKELTDEEKKIRNEKAKMRRDEKKKTEPKTVEKKTLTKSLTNSEKLELTKKSVLDKFINKLVEKEVGKIVKDEDEDVEEVIEKPYEKIKKIQQRVISMNYDEKKDPLTSKQLTSFDLPLENDFYDFLNI